jgi:transcription initiation factor TFIIIB Brf1 subunit/transcription initiation factor TFIIB
MNQSLNCKHQHTRVIAKDSEAEYIECLDCGAVLETSELTESPAPETSSFDESLSDA